jgi:hypothetical protein
VPTGLLALTIASSSLGTLLMTWALTSLPSLFFSLAQRKVEKEMRFFARFRPYKRPDELHFVHNYLWLKHCINLDSGSFASRFQRMEGHFERIDDWIDKYPKRIRRRIMPAETL